MKVGARIKKFRLQKKLVLDDVARRTGMSKPYLSQIENDKASPSLQTLEKLAAAFELPVTYFFLDDARECHVVRADSRQNVLFGSADKPESQRKRIDFLSAPYRNLEMVLLEMPVGYSAGGHKHSHDGEECHLVMEGSIRATQGENSYILSAGDSYHWDGSIPHRIENIGDVPAKLLVARTPPGFLSTRIYESDSGDGAFPRALGSSTGTAEK